MPGGATSRARLWGEQGRRGEARKLLAPVYDSFTEGFNTADLKDAKALIEELAVDGKGGNRWFADSPLEHTGFKFQVPSAR